MGKVWPPGSIALHESTTPLSNIVSIDESPLIEGLIYVGTDDGLFQVTEDGGKTWRKIEDFPGVRQVGLRHRRRSRRRATANVVFAAFNNWQRGDYKPYVARSDDRGRTWTNITGNLPEKHDVWAIAQDHINGNLLFAGTEFGLFFTVDGGRQWTQLRGGMPPMQVRDLQLQRRESDVVHGHVRQRLLDPRRLQPAARDERRDARRRGAAVPVAERLPVHAVGRARIPARPVWRRSAATTRRATRRTARCSRITCARRCRRTRGS